MVREYIVKISDEVIEEIPSLGYPPELIRCKDCQKHYNELMCRCGGYTPDEYFCADGKRKQLKGNK